MGKGYVPYFYAVNQGHQPGVYNTWLECEKNVKGFKGARYKKFSTFKEAEEFCKMPIPTPVAKKPLSAFKTRIEELNKASPIIVLSDNENDFTTGCEKADKKSSNHVDLDLSPKVLHDVIPRKQQFEVVKDDEYEDDFIPLTHQELTDDDFKPLTQQQDTSNIGSFDTNDDFIPLTQQQDTNFIPLTQQITRKRKYMDVSDNNSSDEFLQRYGNKDTTTVCDERIYNDIIINADGEEIRDEPVVIQDLSTIMQTLQRQLDQYERLKQRNKWVYVDTMTWLKDCANNNWKTTEGKQITSDDIQKVMDTLVELKQCM